MSGNWVHFFALDRPQEKRGRSQPLTRRGEKGTVEYTAAGVKNPQVALFFALVRGLTEERLKNLFVPCMEAAREAHLNGEKEEGAQLIVDLFVLAFQTRDCRGGKGERDLFYAMFFRLFMMFPKTSRALLPLVAEFGYHKDYIQLLEYLEAKNSPFAPHLQKAILNVMATNFHADVSKLAAGETSISLCGKYLPREGKSFAKNHKPLFEYWVKMLFPGLPMVAALKVYRQKLSMLNDHLDTVEVNMCKNCFSFINFTAVPGVAAKKYRKAFLNETLKGSVPPSQARSGNRHPFNEDRVKCRQRLKEIFTAGLVKGKQLFPHEIVRPIMRMGTNQGASEEGPMLCAQWRDLRNGIQDTLQAKRCSPGGPAIDLGKLVALVDVSGSMSGLPMEVAIALGLLVSELTHHAFRHRVLTFETKPSWVDFSACGDNLMAKVKKLKAAPWGGTTDIEAAFQLIGRVVESNRLPREEVPDLIIFSDMQFDVAQGHTMANSSAQTRQKMTQMQRIKARFEEIGMRICGRPYPAPRIIFWNLRSGTVGFPAQANENNVMLLSGFSPALFKFVVEGEVGGRTAGDAKGAIDPAATLRKVLDDERYDAVRRTIASVAEEGPLLAYSAVFSVTASAEGPETVSSADAVESA